MKRVYVAMAALICLAGCKSEKGSVESPQTSIVQQVKDAGFKEAGTQSGCCGRPANLVDAARGCSKEHRLAVQGGYEVRFRMAALGRGPYLSGRARET